MSTAGPQALLWPQLLYALAQVAGKDKDRVKLNSIWVEAVDAGTLKLFATDGVALLIAKVPSAHSLEPGRFYSIDPADHRKKPALRDCNKPQLQQLKLWEGENEPVDLHQIKPMLAGPETRAPFDPERASKFFKAVSAVCQRVDARLGRKATFVRCPHPNFEGEVRGVLANLSIRK